MQQLMTFLNAFQGSIKGRVADYGGTDRVGGGAVRKSLAKGGVHDYHMLDLDNGIDLRKPVKGKPFDVGICMDLLEHTTDPFIVATNIQKSLKKGALLFVTVPFVWEIHDNPEDYWRFTPYGVAKLFEKMKVISIFLIRDKDKGEALPRSRIVGVFQK